MAEITWVSHGESSIRKAPDTTPRLQPGDVLVLGAGFSKALASEAPLMKDFLQLAANKKVYEPDGRHSALAWAVRRYFGCKDGLCANIEELATFLVSPANEPNSQVQRDLAYEQLLEVVKYTLAPLWRAVKTGKLFSPASTLARECVDLQIPVISFNYDLIFDNLLHRTGKWNELFGYGPALNASVDFVRPRMDLPPIATMLDRKEVKTVLLKLHGSLNWGIRMVPHADGSRPVEVNPWSLIRHMIPSDVPDATSALEANEIVPVEGTALAVGLPGNPNYYFEPLIIPPLANKSDWYSHPLIRNVWYHAYWALATARRIFVVGYSLPPSDFETINLFREALGSPSGSEANRVILIIDLDRSVVCRFKSMFADPKIIVEHACESCEEWLTSEYGTRKEHLS